MVCIKRIQFPFNLYALPNIISRDNFKEIIKIELW